MVSRRKAQNLTEEAIRNAEREVGRKNMRRTDLLKNALVSLRKNEIVQNQEEFTKTVIEVNKLLNKRYKGAGYLQYLFQNGLPLLIESKIVQTKEDFEKTVGHLISISKKLAPLGYMTRKIHVWKHLLPTAIEAGLIQRPEDLAAIGRATGKKAKKGVGFGYEFNSKIYYPSIVAAIKKGLIQKPGDIEILNTAITAKLIQKPGDVNERVLRMAENTNWLLNQNPSELTRKEIKDKIKESWPNTHEHLIKMLVRAGNWNNEKANKTEPKLPNKKSVMKTIINYANYLERNNIDPKKITLVGIERGGRLPALILKAITGARNIHGLSVNQEQKTLNEKKLQEIVGETKKRGHHLLFVDTKTIRGRQQEIIEAAMKKRGLNRGKHWGLVLPNQNEFADLNLESPEIQNLSQWIDDKDKYLGLKKDGENIIPLVENNRTPERWKLLRSIADVTKDLGGPIKKESNRQQEKRDHHGND